MVRKLPVSIISICIVLISSLLLPACGKKAGDKPFVKISEFCDFAIDTFGTNDAQRYARLFRNEQDFVWLKTFLVSSIASAGEDKKMLQKFLDNFSEYKEKMSTRLDEDRVLLIQEFSRIHNSGKLVNFNWKEAVVLKCEFKSLHTQFGITQGLINMHVSQNGKMYLISNNVFKMGARGYRVMATPRWLGRVN